MAIASFVGIEAASVVSAASSEIGSPVDSALVYTPERLPAAIAEALASVSDRSKVETLANQALASLPEVPTTTTNRIVQSDNQRLLVDLVRASAVIRLVELALETRFESRTEAERLHRLMHAMLERLKQDADTALFRSLIDLQTAVTAFIRDAIANLPTVVSITPTEEVPSIVLAWQLYGSIDAADAIADRNRLPRPGFVPGRPLDIVR